MRIGSPVMQLRVQVEWGTLISADDPTEGPEQDASNEGLKAEAPGLYDATWDESDWQSMIERLVADDVVTWREITSSILGELNPGQVGTGIASSDPKKFGFKKNHATKYPGKSFMPYVLRWFYAQNGRCIDCGTRLDLQADHIVGRETFADPMDADWLNNMALRCRRHNVAKRESHKARAGRTALPAQQSLMWILYDIKPVSKRDFARLCRLYGMTMADVRFDEAWAMAIWLEREGHYRIAAPSDGYDLICWPDNAITRRFATTDSAPDGAELLASDVPGTSVLCFVSTRNGSVKPRHGYTELPLGDIPFAYELGDRPVTDIAIWPTQRGGTPMPPRGEHLHAMAIRAHDERTVLWHEGQLGGRTMEPSPFTGTYFRGRTIRLTSTDSIKLEVER